MNLNKDLPETKLTRRGINNQRARLAQLAAKCSTLIEGVINKAITCPECSKEHNPIEQLSKIELDTIKLVMQKTLPDITPEDIDSVTSEPKSREDILKSVADMLSDRQLILDTLAQYPKTWDNLALIMGMGKQTPQQSVSVQ